MFIVLQQGIPLFINVQLNFTSDYRMGKTEIVKMLLDKSKEIIPAPNCLLCSTPPGICTFI